MSDNTVSQRRARAARRHPRLVAIVSHQAHEDAVAIGRRLQRRYRRAHSSAQRIRLSARACGADIDETVGGSSERCFAASLQDLHMKEHGSGKRCASDVMAQGFAGRCGHAAAGIRNACCFPSPSTRVAEASETHALLAPSLAHYTRRRPWDLSLASPREAWAPHVGTAGRWWTRCTDSRRACTSTRRFVVDSAICPPVRRRAQEFSNAFNPPWHWSLRPQILQQPSTDRIRLWWPADTCAPPWNHFF